MEELDVILDCISLMIKEQSANMDNTSDDLIKNTISVLMDKSSRWYTGSDTIASKLSDYTLELIDYKNSGERLDISRITRFITIEIINSVNDGDVDNDLAFSDTIKSTLIPESDYEELIDSIKKLRRGIFKIYQEFRAKKIVKTASAKLNRSKLGDKLSQYLEEVKLDLDKITELNVVADEAIMGEINLDSDTLMDDVETIVEQQVNHTIYQTGWHDVNKMCQGGIRSGECVFIAALSHKYKTGTTLSLFAGVCMANKFKPDEKGRKPLAIWMSFEDPISNIIEFLYRLIWRTESGENPDMSVIPFKDMVTYIETHLQKSGINVKILRVNPTLWTYKDMFNKIEQYKSRGYDVKFVFADYLDKLPTTGCDKTGPMGSDKRDLVRRVRNWMATREIAFITPWQLNSAANDLTRNGLSDANFVKEIAGKSYYQGNSTLDTDIDLELNVHPARINGRYYLTVQRGKHRLPTTIAEELKFTLLPFPPVGPIELDFNKPKPISFKSVSDIETSETGSSLF